MAKILIVVHGIAQPKEYLSGHLAALATLGHVVECMNSVPDMALCVAAGWPDLVVGIGRSQPSTTEDQLLVDAARLTGRRSGAVTSSAAPERIPLSDAARFHAMVEAALT